MRRSKHELWAWRVGRWLAVVLCLALLPSLADAQDSAHEQFVFAYKLMQRGDTAEAAAEFDRYLQDYPAAGKRTDAAYYRALLLRESGDASGAAALLGRVEADAAELVPAYAVRLLHGQALADLGAHPEALAVLGAVEAGRLEPGLALAVRYLRGQSARAAGQAGAAAQELSAAAALAEEQRHPLRGPVLVELAEAQRSRGDLDAAATALEQALSGDAEAVESNWVAQAARLAGDVAYERGEMDAAVRAYRRVLDRFPGSAAYGPAAVGTLWALYAAERDTELLETYARLIDTLSTQDRATAAYLAGSSAQRRGEHETAVELLEPIAQGDGRWPLQERVLYRLAVSQHALGRDEPVITTVDRLSALFPESGLRTDAAFLAASSRSRMGDAQAGVAELSRFVEAGPGGQLGAEAFFRALRQRAELYAAQGRYDAAIGDFNRYFAELEGSGVAIDDAAELAVLWRFGDTLTAAGRTDEALVPFQGGLDLLRQRRRDGRPLIEQEPEGLLRAGTALAAAGRDERALAVFEELGERHPLHPMAAEATLKRGAVLRRLGRDGEALSAWIEAAEREELSATQRGLALRAAAGVYRAAGRDEDAAVTLGRSVAVAGTESLTEDELLWLAEQRLEAAGDTVEQASMDARTKLVEAERLLAALDGPARRPTAAQRAHRLYLGGRLALRRGGLDEAVESFGRVLALSEGFDLDAQLGLAEAAERRGDLEAARAEYDALTRAEETSVAARAMLRLGHVEAARAASLARQGREREAVDARAAARRTWKRLALLYLDAEAVQPTPQRALLALAELAETMDEPAIAAREYAALAEAFPASPWGRYAAAALAGRYGERKDDASAMLRGLLAPTVDGGRSAIDPGLQTRAEALQSEIESGARP
ncbi:MAG: tetratricopeptide repeat protein [Planctomycetota bacterium]